MWTCGVIWNVGTVGRGEIESSGLGRSGPQVSETFSLVWGTPEDRAGSTRPDSVDGVIPSTLVQCIALGCSVTCRHDRRDDRKDRRLEPGQVKSERLAAEDRQGSSTASRRARRVLDCPLASARSSLRGARAPHVQKLGDDYQGPHRSASMTAPTVWWPSAASLIKTIFSSLSYNPAHERTGINGGLRGKVWSTRSRIQERMAEMQASVTGAQPWQRRSRQMRQWNPYNSADAVDASAREPTHETRRSS